MPPEAKYAGRWARAAGHPDTRFTLQPLPKSALRYCYSRMEQGIYIGLLYFVAYKSVSRRVVLTIMEQGRGDFVWGGNPVALNQSIVLINAYLVGREKRSLHAALHNLDHVMGRNATGYCFATGIAFKSPMHPHRRPSVADGIAEPVPGLLAGEPNPGRQDRCTGYASNEIAINWNALPVYVADALEALMKNRL